MRRNVTGTNQDRFGEGLLLTADAISSATTETEYQKTGRVESCKRGVHNTDWLAWIDGDRKVWGAGKTRDEAIISAVQNAKSHGKWPDD